MNEKNPDSLPADALSARPVQTGDGAPDPAPAEATPAPAPAEAPPAPAPAPSPAALDAAIARAAKALIAEQQADGHWVFELEADCTIPAEYVLLQHYLGEGDRLGVEEKIAAYLYRTQLADGGWPLVHEGGFDISASVKAYFALKMIGEDPESEPMRRARAAILAHGGAARVNVFTRVLLALYGILGWHAVPVMPVEIMLLPRRFPFHLSKISYWARTVIVPMLVLQALKPRARNPKGVRIDELFLEPPASVGRPGKAPHQSKRWFLLFEAIDRVLRAAEPFFPRKRRERAIERAADFVRERRNGEDGLGAIFPAMANSVMMLDVLGYPKDHPEVEVARRGIDELLVVKSHEAYCQPCVSPVWDTVLACQALMEVGGAEPFARALRGLFWLEPLQVLDVVGDWGVARPGVRPGGWAFQYANPHYVDLDDTAVVVMAMDRAARALGRDARASPVLTSPRGGEVGSRSEPGEGGTISETSQRPEPPHATPLPSGEREPAAAPAEPPFANAIARAREWILGLQCRDGGWAAFDADNTFHYLNNIPFADHGALLDPPSADLTGRCLSMLAQLGEKPSSPAMRRGIAWLERDQQEEGSWYGRWGMNYIYGTWSVLCALNAAGADRSSPMVRKAIDWLVKIQNADGGWGEDATSYKLDYRAYEPAPSTSSQTAWALLGLMAVGEAAHPAVERGIACLLRTQTQDGFWAEERYTATGFPRVFYLRYHGYRKFFPLWALARYRNFRRAGGAAPVPFGV
jgi:squalene-hopene/tetraprenyl-beta-curcumene cyclase